jgi:hypothetical protein
VVSNGVLAAVVHGAWMEASFEAYPATYFENVKYFVPVEQHTGFTRFAKLHNYEMHFGDSCHMSYVICHNTEREKL